MHVQMKFVFRELLWHSNVTTMGHPIANISISIRNSICRQLNSLGKRGRHKFLNSVEGTESPEFAPHLAERDFRREQGPYGVAATLSSSYILLLLSTLICVPHPKFSRYCPKLNWLFPTARWVLKMLRSAHI